VFLWHVALGDRHQAGQAAFRREQVVVRVVESARADVVANRKQRTLFVVEEAEVHLVDQGVGARRQAVEPLVVPASLRGGSVEIALELLERPTYLSVEPRSQSGGDAARQALVVLCLLGHVAQVGGRVSGFHQLFELGRERGIEDVRQRASETLEAAQLRQAGF
jgi:hypothetical protein